MLESSGGMGGSVSITVYYGCSTPDEMAYVDKLKLWENEHSVAVVPVMSEVTLQKGYWLDFDHTLHM